MRDGTTSTPARLPAGLFLRPEQFPRIPKKRDERTASCPGTNDSVTRNMRCCLRFTPQGDTSMQNDQAPQRRFYSVGAVASKLGQPIHRIQYLVGARGIQTSAQGGRARLFDEEGLATDRHGGPRDGRPRGRAAPGQPAVTLPPDGAAWHATPSTWRSPTPGSPRSASREQIATRARHSGPPARSRFRPASESPPTASATARRRQGAIVHKGVYILIPLDRDCAVLYSLDSRYQGPRDSPNDRERHQEKVQWLQARTSRSLSF